jgi:TRAP-type C4-dicarboxylate transport system substrate-binding protein
MKNKIFLAVIVVGFLLCLIVSTTSSAAEAFKGKTLKLAAGLPENSIFGKHFKWWASEVEKRTEGKVKVNIYWLESLVKAKDMLPAIQSGFTDAGWIISIYFANNFQLYGLLDHIYNSGEDYNAALNAAIEVTEKEPALKAELEKEKVILVMPYTSGQVLIGTKKCMNSILDLKGKTVRTAGGVRSQFYSNLGANPVFMTAPEMYEALDRGTISAVADAPSALMASFKMQEVAKCMYRTNSGIPAAAGVFMNLDVFRSLPKDIQDMLIKLRLEYAERFAADLSSFEANFFRDVETKNGVTVKRPTPAEDKVLHEAGQKANETLIKQTEAAGYPAGRKVVDYYRSALKRYEAQNASKKK